MLYVVIGPPASGKTTWVMTQATPHDIVIDYDRLAQALTAPGADPHHHTSTVEAITSAARTAAINAAIRYRGTVDVYVIHSMPTARVMLTYRRWGANVVTIDPGQDIVLERCVRERPERCLQAVKDWYASYHLRVMNPADG